MTRPLALSLALALLAGCGTVAPEAPALLPQEAIIARTEGAADASRGAAVAGSLNARAAALTARAAELRRTDVASADRAELLRRAQELEQEQR